MTDENGLRNGPLGERSPTRLALPCLAARSLTHIRIQSSYNLVCIPIPMYNHTYRILSAYNAHTTRLLQNTVVNHAPRRCHRSAGTAALEVFGGNHEIVPRAGFWRNLQNRRPREPRNVQRRRAARCPIGFSCPGSVDLRRETRRGICHRWRQLRLAPHGKHHERHDGEHKKVTTVYGGGHRKLRAP